MLSNNDLGKSIVISVVIEEKDNPDLPELAVENRTY